MSAPLLIEQTDSIVTLTLNRPDLRNPITDLDMVEAVEQACVRINRDPAVRVVILTGSGDGFCSGGNMNHMRDREGMFAGAPTELREGYRHGVQRVTRAVYGLEVPTVAAVNGPAIGAGCDLALMCDLRIASETAIFAESFVRMGLIPGDGGAWLLPRAVGLSRACEMAFTGDRVDAKTALEWGLVSRVVPQDTLQDEARVMAARIAKNPPAALRMTKMLIRQALVTPLDTLLELSAAAQALVHQTRDHGEAVTAFFEKRKSVFTGQ